MHRLLERQIKRYIDEQATLPPAFENFIAAVNEAYFSADADRLMIERSLDLMSRELTEANADLRNELAERRRTEADLNKEKEEQRVLIKKLEDAYSLMLQSEKMASIGQLAAGVAHELNNPIGFVYSNLGTLEKYVQSTFRMIELYEKAEEAIPDQDVRRLLQTAKEELDIAFLKTDLSALMDESKDGITRVKVIVQNLKDFSHVGASDEWHFSDLRKGLDSTLSIVNNEIKYKAAVVKEYGDIPEVECLASQLNQVFMNLLVNAAHAIAERGTITIRTGQEADQVWVDIADTGHGIAPEHMQKIFDPFFTTKPVGKGTGLGLSLSYGIVQKHHGRMEVQSDVGKGTTFRVWLPVKQPQ
ncbi:sensor protein ZraS [mine drainage metagenome]|uniref:Sensor protein ZraS n=1 Tax=mine drainage metagenome TaxID=410659 RepID=A0A1J5T1G4_9ZZZZ